MVCRREWAYWPKSTTPSSITSSPKTLQRFQKDIKKVQRGLDGIEEALDSLSPHLKGQIDRVLSGGLFQVEANRLLTSAKRHIDRRVEKEKHQGQGRKRRHQQDDKENTAVNTADNS